MRSLVLAGCVMAAALSSARADDLEANKELYRHYIDDLWNKKDPGAPDRYLARGKFSRKRFKIFLYVVPKRLRDVCWVGMRWIGVILRAWVRIMVYIIDTTVNRMIWIQGPHIERFDLALEACFAS